MFERDFGESPLRERKTRSARPALDETELADIQSQRRSSGARLRIASEGLRSIKNGFGDLNRVFRRSPSIRRSTKQDIDARSSADDRRPNLQSRGARAQKQKIIER